jgi:outer membrane protein assembly factor BamB
MKRKMIAVAVFALMASGLLEAAETAAKPAEWNQWRGPNRDALSPDTGLLKQWPAEGPSLVWKATGLGGGFSGVSFWGDRVFTMGDQSDGSDLISFNRVDGKKIWSAAVGKAGGNDPQRPGPRCTPATDGTWVIALGQFGDLVCVEAATGKERWRKNLVTDFGGRMPKWNYSESPLLDGDRVLCMPGSPEGTLMAFNKATGAVLWQCKELTDPACYTSVITAEIGGVRQYILMTASCVAGVAPTDGKLLWRAERPGKVAVIPSPVYRDNMVFVTSGYGSGCNAFRITASDGNVKAEQVYANAKLGNHHGGAILVGDYVYSSIEPGNLMCIEFKTGKVVWQNPSVGKASLGYADGHLIVRSEKDKGTVALVEATPEGYKEKGRFDQPDRSDKNSWPHPVIAGGRLYLRDQDVLLCYELKATNK